MKDSKHIYSAKVNKSRGALVGLAVGDALGMSYEFGFTSDMIRESMDEVRHMHIDNDISANYEEMCNINGLEAGAMPKGIWTDDTSMALCLADSLLEKKGYDSYDIMDKFVKWEDNGYRSFFPMGYGIGLHTADAIMDYTNNHVIRRNARQTDSIANGSIMRLAPIVIANHDNDIDEVLYAARLSCRETHNSTGAIAMTELMAATLYLLLHGADKKDLFKKAKAQVKNEDSLDFLESVADLQQAIYDKKGDSLRDLGGFAVDCYDIAMWGLMNFDSFEYGMLGVIGLGGDTDTNAAVYGQLAGAFYGYNEIPDEWKNDLYLEGEIRDLADRLVEMGKYEILRTRFEDERKFVER